MTAEGAEAIRTLTEAVERLSDSIVTQVPWPSWIQALATIVLVIVTLVYVRHTRRMATESTKAAKSAGESVEAARELVRLERNKLALAHEREDMEREREKRFLAEALADELRGLLARWDEIARPDQELSLIHI